MTTINTNTIVSLINTTNNSGTIILPKTSDIPYRTLLFKDLYGTFNTNTLTLNTQSPDIFEDGTSSKIFNDSYTYLTLYADTADSKWVILNGTQINSMTISTLNNIQTANISSVTLNALTFGNGNGFIDATAFRAILMSTIELDASIGNFSSISGDGSQIYNLNAISSLSLQSTTVGLGSFGYISSQQLISTTIGLVDHNELISSITGLGALGFLSSFDSISTNNLSSGNLYAGVASTLQFGASSINTNRANISRLTGAGGATITDNLYPSGPGAQIGFFGTTGTNSGGFYNNINVRSTNTTTITPDIVGVHSNIIRIQGFVSSQQVLTSSIFAQANISTQLAVVSNLNVTVIRPYNATRVEANYIHPEGAPPTNTAIGSLGRFYNEGYFSNIANLALLTSSIQASTIQSRTFISTNEIRTQFLRGAGQFGNLVYATTLLPDGTQSIGNAPNNTWNFVWTSNIQTNTIQSVASAGDINSTVRVLGTLSTQNLNVSTLRGVNGLNINTIGGGISFGATGGGINMGGGGTGNINIGSAVFPFQNTNLNFGGSNAGFAWGQVNTISTNTDFIAPILGAGSITSTVRVLGTLSTQNQLVSSLNANAIYTLGTTANNIVSTNFLRATTINTDTINNANAARVSLTNTIPLQSSNINIGFSALSNFFFNIFTFSTTTDVIQGQSLNGITNINSAVSILGTLSSQNAVVSSISISNASILNLSSFFYGGIEKYTYISSLELQSTTRGLGSFGYLSSLSLQSTIVGLGTFGYLSTNIVPSTIVGLGTFGYLSTNIVPSTIVGLGTFGYLSTNSVPSTIIGLGTTGYISSLSLQSTVRGLGTTGYVSTASLISSIINWSFYLANNTLNMNDNSISSVNNLTTNGSNIFNFEAYFNDAVILTNQALYTNGIATYNNNGSVSFIDNIDMFGKVISNIDVVETNIISSATSTITIQNTIVPSLDNTFDLGASTNTWRHLYVGGGSIYIGSNNDFGVLSYDNSTTNIGINRSLNINNNNISNINSAFTNYLWLYDYNNFTVPYWQIYMPGGISIYDSNSGSNYPQIVYNDGVSQRPIARDWSYYAAESNINASNHDIINVNNLGINLINGVSIGQYDNINWSYYQAISNINVNNYEITNVSQTNTSNSGATNIIARRIYFDIPANFTIDNITFSNVLTTTNAITFMNPNGFYRYMNCTFSFCCDSANDDLIYYFSLSNITNATQIYGQIFDSNYPYFEIQNTILSGNHSITVQDQFTINSWNNGETFIPMMYVKTRSGSHTLANMKFSMVYEPLLE